MRTLWLTLALLLCLAAVTNVFADAIQDSINPLLIPDNNGFWAANYFVWGYTAAKSYTLTDVESKFGPGGQIRNVAGRDLRRIRFSDRSDRAVGILYDVGHEQR